MPRFAREPDLCAHDFAFLQQVVQFVSSNALELLGVDSAQVVPVSSRSALQAKLEAGSAGTVGPCTPSSVLMKWGL